MTRWEGGVGVVKANCEVMVRNYNFYPVRGQLAKACSGPPAEPILKYCCDESQHTNHHLERVRTYQRIMHLLLFETTSSQRRLSFLPVQNITLKTQHVSLQKLKCVQLFLPAQSSPSSHIVYTQPASSARYAALAQWPAIPGTGSTAARGGICAMRSSSSNYH
jgi:hypothetical protein